jgi:hypothetical protein
LNVFLHEESFILAEKTQSACIANSLTGETLAEIFENLQTMEVHHLNHVFEVDPSNLGFYNYDIFEMRSETISLKNILKSDILKDGKKSLQFGPLNLSLLSNNDFTKIQFSDLDGILEKYYKDENWGEDLKIFKQNVNTVFKELKKIKLKLMKFSI